MDEPLEQPQVPTVEILTTVWQRIGRTIDRVVFPGKLSFEDRRVVQDFEEHIFLPGGRRIQTFIEQGDLAAANTHLHSIAEQWNQLCDRISDLGQSCRSVTEW